MFEQLPKFISVAFWSAHRTMRFNDQHFIFRRVKFQFVNCTPGNNHIIAIAEINGSVHGLATSASFMYKKYFVAIGIFEKVLIHTFCWSSHANLHVVIEEKYLSALYVVVLGFNVETHKT